MSLFDLLVVAALLLWIVHLLYAIHNRLEVIRDNTFRIGYHGEYETQLAAIDKEMRSIADRLLFVVIEAETIRKGMGLDGIGETKVDPTLARWHKRQIGREYEDDARGG